MTRIVPLLLGASLALAACTDEDPITTDGASSPNEPTKAVSAAASSSVFATGLIFPRGLDFGPDGNLYVAEAGTGGSNFTDGLCPQVLPPLGPYTGGLTGRISRVDGSGNRTTVADRLPSAIEQNGGVLGPADVGFAGTQLYALIVAGCSHGNTDTPSGLFRINPDGSQTLVADLSQFIQAHPVANPDDEDFEPDGSFYSLVFADRFLVSLEANHGELDRIDPLNGNISRIVDISASQGHIVPTASAYRNGVFYVGNLGEFPIIPGSSKVLAITRQGAVSDFATGFTTILGLAFDQQGRMLVLETSRLPGFPTPDRGRVVRLNPDGSRNTIIDGLNFPTAIAVGPDGDLYISVNGYGPPVPGDILKVDLP